jgi:hypothetical protein
MGSKRFRSGRSIPERAASCIVKRLKLRARIPKGSGSLSRANNLCSSHRLASVALRVIGDVNEQSADRIGKLFAANRTRLFQISCR